MVYYTITYEFLAILNIQIDTKYYIFYLFSVKLILFFSYYFVYIRPNFNKNKIKIFCQ